MKRRIGFVSNSSSSSFVIVVTKEKWDEEFNKLHPYIKAHIDFLASHGVWKQTNFAGKDVVMFGYTSGNASPYEWGGKPDYEGEIPEDMEDDHYGYVDKFERELEKGEHLTCDFDF